MALERFAHALLPSARETVPVLPSPRGEGGRRPDEGASSRRVPPTPHPPLRGTFSPREKGMRHRPVRDSASIARKRNSRKREAAPITDRLHEQPKLPGDNGLRIAPEGVAHHLPTDTCKTDPDLAAVANAWPKLPEAIRAGILA